MTVPETWRHEHLGALIEAKYGKGLPQSKRKGGEVPVYGSNGIVGWHDNAVTSGPTIIIGRKGSSGEVNFSEVPCWPIDTTYYIDAPGPFRIEFLDLMLRSLRLTQLDRSTAIPGLNRDQLYDIEVPVPPEEDQAAVVSLIRALESYRSGAGQHLTSARRAIQRFRQSVLAAACSGRLTADWREGKDEASVNELLLKLEHEPAATGQTRGLDGTPSWARFHLPDSWSWARLSILAESIKYGYTASSTVDEVGPRMLRITDIQNEKVDWSIVPYCRIEPAMIAKYRLARGDLLFARTGATTGKSYLLTDEPPPAVFASYLIRVRLQPKVLPSYIFAFFRSALYWQQVLDASVGTGQPNVNGTKLANLWIPLPSSDEQAEIVRRVEELLALADSLAARIQTASDCVERTSQAILAKAFRGELPSAG